MESGEITKEEKVNEEYQNMMKGICGNDTEDYSGYPDYYAGAYINDDDELTVLLTEQTDAIINLVKKASGNNDIKIKKASYSLNELEDLQRILCSVYQKLYVNPKTAEKRDSEDTQTSGGYQDLLEDLVGMYTDEENNKLVVQIRKLNDKKQEKFTELFGESPFIVFEEGNNFEWTARWRPGRAVFSAHGRLSTGYKCTYNAPNGIQYEGFATAGHGFTRGQHAYTTARGNPIGKCMASRFSGHNDVAFIRITDGSYDSSNELYYPDGDGNVVRIKSRDYMTYAARGSKIYKVGSTTHWTSGRVISNSHTVLYGGTMVSKLLKTTALNLGGDSGGCAYMRIDGHKVAAGTMSGSEYSGTSLRADTFIYSYISQIKYARHLGMEKS